MLSHFFVAVLKWKNSNHWKAIAMRMCRHSRHSWGFQLSFVWLMIVVIVPEERKRWAVAAVHLADKDGASLNSVPLVYTVNQTPSERVVSTFHLVVYNTTPIQKWSNPSAPLQRNEDE